MKGMLISVLISLAVPFFAQAGQRQDPYTEVDMLPTRPALLAPGAAPSRKQATPGMPALFLIGDDPLSHAWLKRRLPVLQQLKAVGLVIQVNSAKDLARIRALAPGLSLYPASADDLAQRLKLTHYPVLITATAIEQ